MYNKPIEWPAKCQFRLWEKQIFPNCERACQRRDIKYNNNNLKSWASTWKMKFNVDKFKVLHLGNQNPQYEYIMCDTCLEAVREEKDMGVIVDEKLKFDTHTVTQANKANRVLGLVRRTFDNLDEEMLVLLYNLFIYCVIFTQEYPISAQHCSPWGSCITCMTKQTSISIHSVIIQWLHWLRGTYIITCIMLITYTCSSLQWLHAGAGSCLVNIMYSVFD